MSWKSENYNCRWQPSHNGGQGTTALTPSLCLKSMLHVPELFVNLLPIYHITKDLNWKGFFFHVIMFFPLYYKIFKL